MIKDKKKILCALLYLFLSFSVGSQPAVPTHGQEHELTLYIMPTLEPLDWTSPKSIYTSTFHCYLKNITTKDNYLLGHVAIKLKSSLLDKPLLTTQTSSGMQEKLDLIFKQKIGLGILGAPITGRMEPSTELSRKLKVYSERNKLTFIRYNINEKAARRIIEFVEQYTQVRDSSFATCNYYGGSFWPLNKNEGAGCSSFGIAVLQLAGIEPIEPEKWIVEVKIPMKLIGGSLNNNKKIKINEIKKTNQWYEGRGVANVDYVNYKVYDPSLMFDWVLNKTRQPSSRYRVLSDDGTTGLLIDATGAVVDENEPMFTPNKEADLFVIHYLQKIPRQLQTDNAQDTTQSSGIPEHLFLQYAPRN